MDNSILVSIKKLLGIDPLCDSFDADVIMHINSVLAILNQLGVGPPEGFFITSNAETWNDLLKGDSRIEFVKTYIYLKVRLVFDPPQSSSVSDSISRSISELEWRIQVAADPISAQ